MKIGYDAKRVFNNGSGLGNYSRTILSNLSKYSDVQCHLYSSKSKPLYNNWLSDLGDPNIIKKGPLNQRYPSSLWRSKFIVNDLLEDDIDLYHGLSNEIPFGLRKIPVVVTIHDLIYRIFKSDFPWIDRQFYELKFKYASRHADKIIAVSESTKRDIIETFGVPEENVSVIYQTCDDVFFDSPSHQEIEKVKTALSLPDRYLLSVGAVSGRKNLKLTLRALAMLKDLGDLHLVVVGGGGKYKVECQELVDVLKLNDRVHFLDHLESNLHLRAIYHQAALLVYPSFYEGFGIPIIEAALCGCPAVVAKTSSLMEAGGPHMLSFDPTQPEDLAAQIRMILSDDVFRRAYISESQSYVRHTFEPQKLTEELLALYASVL